ncbi:MAG TPA: hypothetical protein VJV78_19805 [Polyangiales bacterium]|nr:hypothetical protein [Polyangiales bacterium]
MSRRRLVLLCLIVAACGDDSSAAGSLRVHASGEEAALSGYPVGSDKNEIAFADGWTMQFDKVLISLSDFELKTSDGDDAQLAGGPVVADLHQGEPRLWNFSDIPVRRWNRVSYRYSPPTSESVTANDIEDSDLELMSDEGYSLYIEAKARKDGREVPLTFGFAFEVQMSECENGADHTDGIVISQNSITEAQITVHLDHLFFDSFATEDAKLRFDAMAAVAPESGPLTLADLAKQDNLSDLKGADGKPLDLAYDPGSTFDPVPRNLEEYVVSAATTTGHWNGEGHCVYERE